MNLPPSPFCEIGPAEPEPAAVPMPSVAESFSELTARRSLPIVSPPLPQKQRRVVVVDLDALEEVIVPRTREAPKLVDCVHTIVLVPPYDETEPLPLCLRTPRSEFAETVSHRHGLVADQSVKSLIRTLLELGGDAA